MNELNWFKKHIDTLVILGSFATSMLWIYGKFNTLEKDIIMIKTVLIMRNIMPSELAKCEKNKEPESVKSYLEK